MGLEFLTSGLMRGFSGVSVYVFQVKEWNHKETLDHVIENHCRKDEGERCDQDGTCTGGGGSRKRKRNTKTITKSKRKHRHGFKA